MNISALQSYKSLVRGAEKFWRDEDGQTLVEYGLLINILALTILLTISIMGRKVSSSFNTITNAIKS